MEGEKDPVAEELDLSCPQENLFFRYALDLYNYGYFWESHVYFESLWNAHKREGSVADFLKGMIKLGAAGVKANIGQGGAARAHFERAQELLSAVLEKEGQDFLGLNLRDLIEEIERAKSAKKAGLIVLPHWE